MIAIRMWFTLLLLFATLTSAVVAQRTWTVDRWNRPGADFTDLPAAVTAAADGDLILLRATSGQAIASDYYAAPTVQGKGLTIYGESGAGIPPVQITGWGGVSGVPTTSAMIVSNVTFGYAPFIGMSFQLSNNGGAVVFRGVTFTGYNIFFETIWSNCSLIVLEGCSLLLGEGRFTFRQSKVMMSDTLLTKAGSQYSNGQPGAWVDNCEVHMNACTAIGGSASASNPLTCSAGLMLIGSSIVQLSGSCRIEGGSGSFGACQDIQAWDNSYYIYYDASTIFPHGINPGPRDIVTPRTGIATSTVGNTIHIDQSQPAATLTFLAMAPLLTSPWTNILGPVYLDPNLVWTGLAVAPSAGVLRRSFVVPPSIPKGQWIGVQAFALHPQTLAVLNSNATIVGVW